MKHNCGIYIPLQRFKAMSYFEDIKIIRDGAADTATRLISSKSVFHQDKIITVQEIYEFCSTLRNRTTKRMHFSDFQYRNRNSFQRNHKNPQFQRSQFRNVLKYNQISVSTTINRFRSFWKLVLYHFSTCIIPQSILIDCI